ncbi:MAG TPA: oligosaccharide flippase family protein, partial [Bacteroidota bacterium]|nr:oligosaccharide flippase family protein [Bacteroidota bacterium]
MASQTKKIAFDTAALLSGKAIGLILGIVRLNYLTTYLGVEGFGILNFALYFSSLFQVLFDIGVAQITIREIAQRPAQSRELVGTVLILKILIS